MIEEQFIWERFKNGDRNALILIYNQHINLLYQYGKKFVNDKELIKDAIQDLFYNLIDSRHKLSNTDNIKFYLMKSFRCQLLRNLKVNKRIHDEVNEYKFLFENPISVEEHIIFREESKEYNKLLRNGLKKLNSKQREILYYKFTFGFGYDEICDIMSIKYDSARKQVFRALRSLREELSKEDQTTSVPKKSAIKIHRI